MSSDSILFRNRRRWFGHCFLFLLLAAALLATLIPPAQAANGTGVWTNRFSEVGADFDGAFGIAVDRNGNAVVTGYSRGGFVFRSAQYVTIAYSAAGTPMWTNRFHGTGGNDSVGLAIALDTSGNVFVTGQADGLGSAIDFGTVAYSPNGSPKWTNIYNGPANGSDGATKIVVDPNGNVIVAGFSPGIGSSYDYATIKYSGDGNPLWTNRYDGPASDTDNPLGLAVDANGSVYVTGSSVGAGGPDFATVAYSSAGVPLWTNRYDGPGGAADFATAVAVNSDGNIIVTGYSAATGSGSTDYATIAYSPAGIPLWTNRYNGPSNFDDNPTAIAVDGAGNIFVTGYSFGSDLSRDYATVAYSGAGVPLWTNRYNGTGSGDDRAYSVAVDGSGNVIVTGASTSPNGSPDYDFVTIAYSNTGVPLWTNRFAGAANNDDSANSVALDAGGNVFVTGRSFNAGTDSDYLTIKYSAAFNLAQETASNGQFHFRFNADANVAHTVEYTDFLVRSNWTTLSNFPAMLVPTNISFVETITNSARFYRVRRPE